MPVGRPTKYNQELVDRAQAYVDDFTPDAKNPLGEVVPTIAGLACVLKISRETIYDWSKCAEKRRFSDIVGEIMVKQEKMLFRGGLNGDYNASITKLALTKHGYSDKQTTDLTVDVASLTIDQLEAIAGGKSTT